MIYLGLVSVTFRQLQPTEIIDLVSQAGLNSIEWGGDIHVPHGHLQQAKEIGELTRNAGLEVAAYGSYFRAGCAPEDNPSIEDVVQTAIALQAPTIRIWAGNKGSRKADEEWWQRVITDCQAIADAAHSYNKTISLEYHENTLTDNPEDTINLLQEINRPNVYTYWQPPNHTDTETRMQSLRTVQQHVSNVHVFHWDSDGKQNIRRPLKEGTSSWKQYFSILQSLPGDRHALLEFVMGDQTEQFIQDAQTLKNELIG